nr:MAG TPA: hypothetical protein [Caudoviricetes sp.]
MVLFRFFKIKKSSVSCSCFCIKFGRLTEREADISGYIRGFSPI